MRPVPDNSGSEAPISHPDGWHSDAGLVYVHDGSPPVELRLEGVIVPLVSRGPEVASIGSKPGGCPVAIVLVTERRTRRFCPPSVLRRATSWSHPGPLGCLRCLQLTGMRDLRGPRRPCGPSRQNGRHHLCDLAKDAEHFAPAASAPLQLFDDRENLLLRVSGRRFEELQSLAPWWRRSTRAQVALAVGGSLQAQYRLHRGPDRAEPGFGWEPRRSGVALDYRSASPP